MYTSLPSSPSSDTFLFITVKARVFSRGNKTKLFHWVEGTVQPLDDTGSVPPSQDVKAQRSLPLIGFEVGAS